MDNSKKCTNQPGQIVTVFNKRKIPIVCNSPELVTELNEMY